MKKTKPSYILTVTLNPAVDKFLTAGIKRVELNAGGKGINVSRALKALGIKSLATGLIDGSAGEFIRKNLRREGIAHDFQRIKNKIRTNVTLLNGRKKELNRILELGPKVTTQEWKAFLRKFTKLAQGARWITLSGSVPPGLPSNVYAQLIALARKHGKKCVLDTSGAALEKGLAAAPFIVKPNRQEAEGLVRKKLNSWAQTKKAIERFHRAGTGIVLLTLGRDGAVFSCCGFMLRAIPPRIKTLNTVGCGDAFLAGFMAALTRSSDLSEAFRWATAAGGANALSSRPGKINPKILLKLAKKIRIKKV